MTLEINFKSVRTPLILVAVFAAVMIFSLSVAVTLSEALVVALPCLALALFIVWAAGNSRFRPADSSGPAAGKLLDRLAIAYTRHPHIKTQVDQLRRQQGTVTVIQAERLLGEVAEAQASKVTLPA